MIRSSCRYGVRLLHFWYICSQLIHTGISSHACCSPSATPSTYDIHPSCSTHPSHTSHARITRSHARVARPTPHETSAETWKCPALVPCRSLFLCQTSLHSLSLFRALPSTVMARGGCFPRGDNSCLFLMLFSSIHARKLLTGHFPTNCGVVRMRRLGVCLRLFGVVCMWGVLV